MNTPGLLAFLSLFIVNTLSAELSTLTVQGTATQSFPSDQLQCSIGVITQGSDAQSALNSNNLKMKEVIQAIKKLGLSAPEYSTGQFSIRPIYSQRPKNAASDWKRTIVGHEVTNRLNIRTEKITLTPELIDVATRAGANSIDHITFGLKDSLGHRKMVIADATARAVEDAKALADSANLKLARIHSITLDEPPRVGVFQYAKAMDGVPIEAGDVEVKASVKIVYELP